MITLDIISVKVGPAFYIVKKVQIKILLQCMI